MCGRYKRRSDKQKIAEAFSVNVGLDETFFEPGDDFSPQSIQPVIHLNEDGDRQIEMMRWSFKLPDRPRPLFNARSEGIERAAFWKNAFLKGRCIVPGDAIFEWKEVEKGRKKPKYEFVIPGQEPFGMAAVWRLWKEPEDRAVGANLRDPDRRAQRIDGSHSQPHDHIPGTARLRGISCACRKTAGSPATHFACEQDEGDLGRDHSNHQQGSRFVRQPMNGFAAERTIVFSIFVFAPCNYRKRSITNSNSRMALLRQRRASSSCPSRDAPRSKVSLSSRTMN